MSPREILESGLPEIGTKYGKKSIKNPRVNRDAVRLPSLVRLLHIVIAAFLTVNTA